MRSVSFARLLERTWNGIAGMVRPSTPAAFFRQADRYRNEGRYDEAARLVARGLQLTPDSSVGHLLSGYLYVAARRMDRSKTSKARRSCWTAPFSTTPISPRRRLSARWS